MGFQRDSQVKWHPAKHGMSLESPHSDEFREELKAVVPGDERRWHGDTRRWWISDCYLDEVDALLFKHFEQRGAGRDI